MFFWLRAESHSKSKQTLSGYARETNYAILRGSNSQVRKCPEQIRMEVEANALFLRLCGSRAVKKAISEEQPAKGLISYHTIEMQTSNAARSRRAKAPCRACFLAGIISLFLSGTSGFSSAFTDSAEWHTRFGMPFMAGLNVAHSTGARAHHQ